MNDLWGELVLETAQDNDSKAIEILREQARILEKKTNGRIKATFSKINYKSSSADLLGQALLTLAPTIPINSVEIVESELEGKKDINEMYNYSKYKFEIYNDTYRFRVFILKFRYVFPLELIVEEGIREELKISECITINSDDELIEKVALVFSSEKMRLIIRRMYEK